MKTLREIAAQLVADDLANGYIEKNQAERQLENYIHWLENLKTAVYHEV